jgi:hypothetical protein
MTDSHADAHDESLAAEAAALVDTLLPGDETFPSASSVGAHSALIARWSQRFGAASLAELFGRIGADGGPLRCAGANERAAAMAAFADAEPDRFAALRRIVYLSYYESLPVVAAIAGLGHDYRAAPQPEGYALPAFDPARDAPRHRRGSYLATDAVSRVDVSGLAHLEPR